MSYKDNNFLILFDIVLDFVYFISKYKEENIIVDNKKIDFSCDFAIKVCKIVYDAKDKGKINVISNKGIESFTFPQFSLDCQIDINSDLLQLFEEKISVYNNSWLDEKLLDLLNKAKNEYFKIHDEISKCENIFNIDSNLLTNYLETYYKLIIIFYRSRDYYQQIDKKEFFEIIDVLLYQDTNITNDEIVYSYNAPICLKKIQDIYLDIEKYYHLISNNPVSENNHLVYKNIILESVKKIFNWKILFDKKLLNASIQNGKKVSATEDAFANNAISFDMLYDSILTELNTELLDKTYKILIIGKNTIIDIEKIKQRIKEELNIIVEINCYSELLNLNKKELDNELANNDICYIFDDKLFYIIDHGNDHYDFFKQQFIFSKYYEYNALENVILQYTLAKYFNDSSLIACEYKLKLNPVLINFLNRNIPVHLFLDISTHDQIFDICMQLNKEVVTQKHFNNIVEIIINNKKIIKNNEKIFTFKLEDFYKYFISVDEYLRVFKSKNSSILDIIICIDYARNVTYTNPHKIDEDVLKKEIEDNFLIYFKNEDKVMREKIFNALYNLATNPNELLLAYILSSNTFSLNNKGISDKSIGACHVEQRFFEHKELYNLWFKYFNISSNSYVKQTYLRCFIEKNYKDEYDKFIQVILKSCKNIKYEYSYLKENTKTLEREKR